MAVAALVCGCIGFVFPLTAPVAIILGAVHLSHMSREPHRYDGRGMAIAGLVLGAFVTVMMILIFVFFIAIIKSF